MRELTVPAVLEEIDRIRGFLREYLGGLPLAEDQILPVELSLHEICVNIAMYAYPAGAAGDVSVRLWNDDGTVCIEVRDRGVPFDPASKPDPDLLAKVRRGQGGGLGVYLFKTLMDGFTYRREAGQNILTIFKKFAAPPPPAQ
jgi:anti-sigma regulatory factor (Ser/Thr protein kinase)